MIFLASNFTAFPSTNKANSDGLLAIGGNLLPETLLKAYSQGIFPWYNEGDPICWYAPPERCVLFPQKVKVSKSMRQVLRKQEFKVTKNQAFERVIGFCAGTDRKGQDGTWISSDIQESYIKLHKLGLASSIEVWKNGELVGGLYGVEQGHVFCGESMFSLVSNASKVAFIHLCQCYNYELIDCQVSNEHLLSLGAEIVSRYEFEQILQK